MKFLFRSLYGQIIFKTINRNKYNYYSSLSITVNRHCSIISSSKRSTQSYCSLIPANAAAFATVKTAGGKLTRLGTVPFF